MFFFAQGHFQLPSKFVVTFGMEIAREMVWQFWKVSKFGEEYRSFGSPWRDPLNGRLICYQIQFAICCAENLRKQPFHLTWLAVKTDKGDDGRNPFWCGRAFADELWGKLANPDMVNDPGVVARAIGRIWSTRAPTPSWERWLWQWWGTRSWFWWRWCPSQHDVFAGRWHKIFKKWNNAVAKSLKFSFMLNNFQIRSLKKWFYNSSCFIAITFL